MEYKVCILAAGQGTRLSYAKDYHKALLPVGEKSALSHIIDKFPKNIEIVIAVGYNAHLIRDFVNIAYRNRKITLVDINPYQGEGSGPGYSLYSCRHHLNCPFIFTSADTIVEDIIPEPSTNWLGVAHCNNPEDYCIAGVYGGLVKEFYIKRPMNELLKSSEDPELIFNNAFIGMAGVFDYSSFWQGFEKNHQKVQGEVQVMDGLEELVPSGLFAKPFTWFDTGNDVNYYFANKHFSKLQLLAKPGESIYFEDGLVIKYFADKQIIKDRVDRANQLKGLVPEIKLACDNFYAYEYVDGVTLSRVQELEVFERFLNFCKDNLWKSVDIDDSARANFKNALKTFYFDKTNDRIEKFYKETGVEDRSEKINGVLMPPLKDLLKQVDWESLFDSQPVLFHGDLQPENILVTGSGFCLIDWRHNFGDVKDYGDVYYDLAKLYHALIISHEIIRKGEYNISQDNGNVVFSYLLKNNLLKFKDSLDKFIVDNGYDLKKIKLLTSLIFLNISPMHNYPYNMFLYYLGKEMLYKSINDKEINNMSINVNELTSLYIAEQITVAKEFPMADLNKFVERIIKVYEDGGTVYICGNGGNAAFADNFLNDLSFLPFVTDDKSGSALDSAKRTKVVNLAISPSTITGLMNDFGPDHVFSQQLEGHIKPGDVVIGFSGSGNSANIIKTFELAKASGASTMGITRGDGGKTKQIADIAIVVPGTSQFPGQVGKNNNNFHFEDYLSSIAHITTGILQKYLREKYEYNQ
jgi:phosphoheptose isomerase/dTDP-glucose pyrophosphorylase